MTPQRRRPGGVGASRVVQFSSDRDVMLNPDRISPTDAGGFAMFATIAAVATHEPAERHGEDQTVASRPNRAVQRYLEQVENRE